MHNIAAGQLLWHRHLQESTSDVGAKYRAFVYACHRGPICSSLGVTSFVGTTELAEDVKDEVQNLTSGTHTSGNTANLYTSLNESFCMQVSL